jgi:hypothetical protein
MLFDCTRRCRIARARDAVACCGGGAVAGEAGRATSPAGTRDTATSPLTRSCGRRPPRRTVSRRSSSGARLTLRRQHRGDALCRKGLSAPVEVPLGGQRLRDRPQAQSPLPLGLGEFLCPLDDLWARLGVALATVDLHAGRGREQPPIDELRGPLRRVEASCPALPNSILARRAEISLLSMGSGRARPIRHATARHAPSERLER